MECILKELLNKKGKSVYWLIREAKISHKAAYDLVNNQTKGIKFDTLEKICLALKCKPNDVLRITTR